MVINTKNKSSFINLIFFIHAIHFFFLVLNLASIVAKQAQQQQQQQQQEQEFSLENDFPALPGSSNLRARYFFFF